MHLSFCEFKEPVPFYCILPSILKYDYYIHVTQRITVTMTRWFVIVHEAKFGRKSVTRYFDLLFLLFFFYIFYPLLLLLFFSPSTVESKTIGYLECPREHSSFDTDSQVWWLDRLHVSLFERISMAHGQRFDSRRKRICRFWQVSFLLKDYVLLFEFSHDMWKCCSSERVESSWGCNAW